MWEGKAAARNALHRLDDMWHSLPADHLAPPPRQQVHALLPSEPAFCIVEVPGARQARWKTGPGRHEKVRALMRRVALQVSQRRR